jgi:hypothetical protein
MISYISDMIFIFFGTVGVREMMPRILLIIYLQQIVLSMNKGLIHACFKARVWEIVMKAQRVVIQYSQWLSHVKFTACHNISIWSQLWCLENDLAEIRTQNFIRANNKSPQLNLILYQFHPLRPSKYQPKFFTKLWRYCLFLKHIFKYLLTVYILM